MTLPFRRRHHDDEASHDRARAIWSTAMLEPLEPAAEAWLAGHLEGCGECRVERERYLADRELLRSLRGATPEPPRDLWARTAAAIEQEAAGGRRGLPSHGAGQRRRPFASLPLSAASGLLVVVVVVGAALLSRETRIDPPGVPTPGATDVAVLTVEPGPTPLTVAAAEVGWLRPGADGNYDVLIADIDEVCPNQRPSCPNLEQSVQTPLKLGGQPLGVTLSPIKDELVVISAADGARPGTVLVVPVPGPGSTPAPVATTEPPGTIEPPATIDPTQSVDPTPTADPTATAEPTPVATDPQPEPTAAGTREIATGVIVVGDPAYSPDGQWLAFSARPADLSTGPDLYLWNTNGDLAVAVTVDHRTYFSSWFGDQILASRVELGASQPDPSGQPAGSPATADQSAEPEASPADGATAEARPVSFLLDPATLAMTDLAEPNVWLPVVDPSGRVVVYWSGSVALSADGLDWLPAEGRLVLDRWAGLDEPDATEEPAAESGEPVPSVGPAGEPTTLAQGPLASFDARFDPDGTRLGLWTLDRVDAEHGRLQLIVVDPEAGAVDRTIEPLDGVPALRGFSINQGRLAWVTPPGQDGHESSVQVLAWHEREFGHVQTIPAPRLIVLR